MHNLSNVELAVCKAMGIDEKDYVKVSSVVDHETSALQVASLNSRQPANLQSVEQEVCRRLGISHDEYKKANV